jgi:hypothetical protein
VVRLSKKSQTDFDKDGFPYWLEVNMYNTSPLINNRGGDADDDGIPIEWAEKKARKEDQMAPLLKRMERQNQYGVYFIYKSMEQGSTFRCSIPKFPTKDPNYTLLRKTRSRFTHYYFYLRDPQLGPMILRIASFLPFQATYWINGHSFLEAELNRTGICFRVEFRLFTREFANVHF